MDKVLLVSFFFPPWVPWGSGGLQRLLKFIKYLPETGWSPVVLTATQSWGVSQDLTLLKELPGDIPIYRAPCWWCLSPDAPAFERNVHKLISRALFLPDTLGGWLIPAIRRGRQIIEEEKCSVIYTTIPPVITSLVGYGLKMLTGRPWVLDFRDPWVAHPARRLDTLWKKLRMKLIDDWQEALVVQSADKVIVVNQPMAQQMQSRYAGLSLERFNVIPNGYDPVDWAGLAPMTLDRFTLTHTGSLAPSRDMRRGDPRPFLRGLKLFLTRNKSAASDIQVRFIGSLSEEDRCMLQSEGLGSVIQISGYVPYRESLRYQISSHVLLLFLNPVGTPAAYRQSNAAKVVEYLASGRFILAIAEACQATDMVRQLGRGMVVSPDDVEGIAASLSNLYDRYKAGELDRQEPSPALKAFRRAELTRQLGRCFSEVVAGNEFDRGRPAQA